MLWYLQMARFFFSARLRHVRRERDPAEAASGACLKMMPAIFVGLVPSPLLER